MTPHPPTHWRVLYISYVKFIKPIYKARLYLLNDKDCDEPGDVGAHLQNVTNNSLITFI